MQNRFFKLLFIIILGTIVQKVQVGFISKTNFSSSKHDPLKIEFFNLKIKINLFFRKIILFLE
jgi:hypothetical protein